MTQYYESYIFVHKSQKANQLGKEIAPPEWGWDVSQNLKLYSHPNPKDQVNCIEPQNVTMFASQIR